MDAEAVKRAKQHAGHKYQAVLEELIPEYQDRLAEERSALAARGLTQSGQMAVAVSKNVMELAKRQIQARADALIDGFELHSIPLDEEAEGEIMKDIQDLRTNIVGALKNAAPRMGGISPEMGSVIAHSVDQISVPWNALKAQIEERRFRPRMSPLAPSQSSVTNVSYHLHGHGSKVNIDSTDQSSNEFIISSDQVFIKLREHIQNDIPEPDRTLILAKLEELEAAQSKPTLFQRYAEFMSLVSSHITVIAPLMPALAELFKGLAR